ncbi:hypothetical protein [Actinomadura rupiterrae]|nr:hypothetical protein [Actinomadura rupiterrae]MCP2339587.1 hypothetical protein [Actinomadura rupiterrae]
MRAAPPASTVRRARPETVPTSVILPSAAATSAARGGAARPVDDQRVP